MIAYCYASGLIEFGQRIPDGAIIIASGDAKAVRGLIESTARHGYSTHLVRGRPTMIPGSDTLLVPGVPEAVDQSHGISALCDYKEWIAGHKRPGVHVVRGFK
jgi:hypothetical protein